MTGHVHRAPEGWGSQIFRQSAHEGSPTHWPPLTPPPPPPRETTLVLISVRDWVDLSAIVRQEGLSQWKIPVTGDLPVCSAVPQQPAPPPAASTHKTDSQKICTSWGFRMRLTVLTKELQLCWRRWLRSLVPQAALEGVQIWRRTGAAGGMWPRRPGHPCGQLTWHGGKVLAIKSVLADGDDEH
jgi:hypothetical protein